MHFIMVGCHHWLNGHECEQTPGDRGGQRSQTCCSPLGSQGVAQDLVTDHHQQHKMRFITGIGPWGYGGEKSHDLLPASRRTGKAGGLVSWKFKGIRTRGTDGANWSQLAWEPGDRRCNSWSESKGWRTRSAEDREGGCPSWSTLSRFMCPPPLCSLQSLSLVGVADMH